MPPVEQLVERLNVAEVQRYSAKGAGVGVGGVTRLAERGGSGGHPQENNVEKWEDKLNTTRK